MGPRTDARLLAAPAAMVASVVVGEAGVWHGLSVSASDIIEVNLAQGFEVIVLGIALARWVPDRAAYREPRAPTFANRMQKAP